MLIFVRQSAASQLGGIAEYVDQKAKDAENVQKMHNIQEILLGKYDTLLDPQRRFVHEGLVYEVKGKDMQLRALFQFTDLIVWAKVKKIEKKAKKGTAKGATPQTELEFHYHSRVSLMNCSLSAAEDQSKNIKNCFILRTPDKNFMIATETPEDKRKWMTHLSDSIKGMRNRERKGHGILE